jgi:hypothetical protein
MLLALGISMLTGSASYAVGWGVPVSLTISLLAFSVVMALRVIHLNLHKLNTDPIVHYLNHQYPELEDSTDLLLRSSSSLTLLQQLQQAKVRERFKGVYPHVQFPNRIKTSSIVFVLACTGAITLTSLSQKTRVIIPADVASGKQDHPENQTTSTTHKRTSVYRY